MTDRSALSALRSAASRVADLILSRDPAQRTRLRLVLVSAALYACWIIGFSVKIATQPQVPISAYVLVLWDGMCILLFYGLIRSGLTRHLRDPAIVVPQMLAAGAGSALCYVTMPELRPAIVQLLCLVQMFGLFNLRARGVLVAGFSSIAMLLAAELWALQASHTQVNFWLEGIEVASAAVILCYLTLIVSRHAHSRARLRQQRLALADAVARTEALIITDPLTGLPNRQHSQTLLAAELARHEAGEQAFSLALVDLDHFKRINDQFGHAVGDTVLCRFADEVRQALREVDVVGRWGGEEFVVMLRQCASQTTALVAIERLHHRLNNVVLVADQPILKPTFSAGVAVRLPGETLHHLLERADRALYAAKHGGRARSVLAPAEHAGLREPQPAAPSRFAMPV